MLRAPQEVRAYFITTVTASRRRLFQVHANAELLLGTLEDQRSKGRMHLHAFVIMPDHVHLLLTPAPEVSLEKAMQYVKGGFSFRLKSKLGVWEQSYDSRRITSSQDFVEREQYIRENPVRARIAASAEAFPFSSASKRSMIDPPPQHFSQ